MCHDIRLNAFFVMDVEYFFVEIIATFGGNQDIALFYLFDILYICQIDSFC